MTATVLRPALVRIWSSHRSTILVMAGFTVFALNFGAYRVFGDGELYYSFLQRLFGDTDAGTAYGFGTGLLNLPFFALGKLLDALPLGSPLDGSFAPPMITIASVTYVLVAIGAAAWLLRALGARNRAVPLIAAVFGSPLWYYASFSPSYNHAADTATLTLASVVLLLLWRNPSRRRALTLGALLALAVAIRPGNLGFGAGVLAALLFQRHVRPAAWATAGATVVGLTLLLLPLSLGLALNERQDGTVIGSASDSFRGGYTGDIFGWAPETLWNMLLSLHRGLFTWTPVTVLGVVGVVLLLRRPSPDRGFVVALAAGAVGLWSSHVGLVFWDGGWSFSMRYLTGLFPLYAIGLAHLFDAAAARAPQWRVLLAGATAVAVTWSLFVGFNHTFGAMSQHHNVLRPLRVYAAGERSPSDFARDLWAYSRLRHAVERLTP